MSEISFVCANKMFSAALDGAAIKTVGTGIVNSIGRASFFSSVYRSSCICVYYGEFSALFDYWYWRRCYGVGWSYIQPCAAFERIQDRRPRKSNTT